MKRVKLILAAVLLVLIVVVIMQNLDTAQTRVLFWEPSLPLALLLAIAFFVGLIVGLVTAGIYLGKRRKGKTEKAAK